MKTKSIIWLLIILALASVVLVACGSGDEAAQEEEKEAPAPSEPVTITVWDFGGSEFQWLDDIAIPRFQDEHPNITIEHVGVPEDELGLKIETAIAAGDVPDLAVFVPNRVIKAGHVLPLDDYMAQNGILRDDYCPMFLSANIFEGKVWSLPIDTNIWVMMYNKDLFGEAGLSELGPDDVITYDDWLANARAINKPADSLDERVWGSTFFWPQWNSMGNYMSDPFVLGADGRTCTGNADTGDWLHFWDLMETAWSEDLTTETAGALLADVEEDMFVQGKLGMTYAALGDAIYAKQNDISVGLTGQPVVSEGWDGNAGGWNTSYSIMKNAKHPDEAWEFLKWLSIESPKHVPIGTDALDAAGGGLPGLPCYTPLLEYEKIKSMVDSEPLVQDAVKLMERIKSPPFTVDIWTSTEPFYTAFDAITQDGMEIEAAVGDATAECQEITDQLWEDFDALSE